MAEMTMLDRISIDPNVCHGKPCIKGTRIPVHVILELLAAGYTFDRILTDCYPHLTEEDLQAAVTYAALVIENEEVIPLRVAA